MTLKTLALIVASSLIVCVASAEDKPSVAQRATLNEARMHFERGVELYREGSYDAALVEFQRTHELAPNYKILYNLAQVQAERHEYVAAVKLLNEYLQQGGNEIPAERRQSVAQDLEKLVQRIAMLSISVNVEDAEVFVNEVSVGRSPLTAAVPVNVGNCRVRAEKPGYVTQSRTITVAGTDRSELAIKLEPTPVALRTAPVRTVTSRNMTPFWISVGATVVLGGATGVFGALALGANHDLDQALNRFPMQQGSVDSARSKVRTMAALTDGFGAGTLVAAAASVYFLLSPPEHTEIAPSSGGVRASVAPTLTGVSVSGTF